MGGDPGLGRCGGREETNVVEGVGYPIGPQAGLLYFTDFEIGLDGWTPMLGSPPAGSGDFIVGDPVGTGQQPELNHTLIGFNCAYTAENPGGAAGTDDVDGGEVMIVSPTFNGAAMPSARLNIWRWFGNRDLDEDVNDYFAIDVSNDGGGSWSNMLFLDSTVDASVWTLSQLTLDAAVPLTSNMQVRVRVADGSSAGNIIEGAIDDIEIYGHQTCTSAEPLQLLRSNAITTLTPTPDVAISTILPLDAGDRYEVLLPGNLEMQGDAATDLDHPLIFYAWEGSATIRLVRSGTGVEVN